MANRNKERKATEGKLVVVKILEHLANADARIDKNPETGRYALRHNGEFLMSDINQDVVRRTANEKFNLADANWQEPK